MTNVTGVDDRLWSGPYGRVILGIFSLAFLVAFESLAVATIMPLVAEELDGLGLYAVSFAAPMAVAVVSMTVAGPLMDRRGPGLALRAGVAIFATGLVVAGAAQTMPVFLAGRAIQGLGMGFVGVGLYVVIGQAFPASMRARVFTVVTSAWVLPALVGPVVAGFVAEQVGWRWVFLGVPVLAAAALALIWGVLARLTGDPRSTSDPRRIGWAVATVAGILLISVAGQQDLPVWPAWFAAGVVLTVAYAPKLLPTGTWRGRRGLPSVLLTRSLLSAGFFGAEVYVPLSLIQHRDLGPTEAGLFLTGSAVMWFAGSWLAANVPALGSKPLRVRLGAVCVLIAILTTFLTLYDAVPLPAVAAGWALGGLGMGLAMSTLGVLLLDHSRPGEQGANSAAMQTNDAVVQSLLLSFGSIVFAALLTFGGTDAYVAVLALATLTSIGAVAIAMRVEVP